VTISASDRTLMSEREQVFMYSGYEGESGCGMTAVIAARRV